MANLGVTLEWDNLDQAFEQFEAEEITPIVRGLAVFLWDSILRKTPQYFGGMAASWTWTYSPSNFKDRSQRVTQREPADLQILFRGHPAAIAIANAASAGRDAEFKLGRTIYFTNGVNHGEGYYAGVVESWDSDKLRTFNRPGKPLSRSLDMIQSRFGTDISRGMAVKFKDMKIGGASAASDS